MQRYIKRENSNVVVEIVHDDADAVSIKNVITGACGMVSREFFEENYEEIKEEAPNEGSNEGSNEGDDMDSNVVDQLNETTDTEQTKQNKKGK